MGVLAVADFNYYTDKLAAGYLAALGTSGSGLGLGDSTIVSDASAFGLDRKMRDILNHLQALTDYDQSHSLLEAAHNAKTNAPAELVVPGIISNLFGALNADCAAAGLTGVNSIDAYSTYWNLNGPSTALLAPEFSDLYLLIRGVRPTLANVYSPAIANMGQRAFGGGFSDGTAVDTTKYGGVALLQAQISSWAGTSGTLTVTGTNQAGQTGRTWTGTIAGNGNVTLTPGVATDLCADVTGITLPGSLSAGTIIIAGLVPAGRSAPPV